MADESAPSATFVHLTAFTQRQLPGFVMTAGVRLGDDPAVLALTVVAIGGEPVSPDIMRRVRFRDLIAAAESQIRQSCAEVDVDPSVAEARADKRALSDAELARFARAYLDAQKVDRRRALEVLCGASGMRPPGARARLAAARRRGLLTSAPSGKAGGSLTPAALQLLGI